MNAERLHIIAIAIRDEFKDAEILTHLNDLEKALDNMVNELHQDYQQEVSESLTSLYGVLELASSNDFSPNWRQILECFGVEDIIGLNLKEKLQDVFERNQITPSIALEEIKSINKTLTEFNTAINQIIDGFQTLKIGAEELDPGECEIGVLVPRNSVNNELEDFAKELFEINRIFNTFSEITTGTREGYKLRNISSSDLGIFLDSIPAVVACVAVAIERIVTLYKQILEIRILQSDLKKQKVPNKALSGIKKHVNTVMEKGIEKLAKEIMRKHCIIDDEKRKREVEIELRVSLRKIANRIDKGYSFEIRAEPEEYSNEENDNIKKLSSKDSQHIQTILDSSKALRFVEIEGESILSLPESTEDKKK